MGHNGVTLGEKKYFVKTGPIVTKFKEGKRQEQTGGQTETHVNVAGVLHATNVHISLCIASAICWHY